MGRKRVTYDEYNKRLLLYIISYVRQNGVPPTIELMIENVEGKQSKSTVYNRLQEMVDAGLLVQKHKKGYYYPTYIEEKETIVPKILLKEIHDYLEKSEDGIELAKRLSKYIKE